MRQPVRLCQPVLFLWRQFLATRAQHLPAHERRYRRRDFVEGKRLGEGLVGVRNDAEQPVDGHHVLALDAGDAAGRRQDVGAGYQGRSPQVSADAHGFEVVGGSFFESVPEGGDAYLLKSVLHDWEDQPAIKILATCRRAARAGTALIVIERTLADPTAKLADLNMLVGPGGRERAPEEYAALLAAARYELTGETPTAAGVSVFEARAI